MDDQYLGDGVYAAFDGNHIVLDLRSQDETARISLDSSVFNNLVLFEAAARNEAKQESEN